MNIKDINIQITKITEKNKFFSVSADSKLSEVFIFVNFININLTNKLNGLSHLCEHIFLKMVEDKYLDIVKEDNIDYMGFTDYTYTVFKFTLPSDNYFIDILIKVIFECLEIKNIKESYVLQSKNEVITECRNRKSEVEETLPINMFLTDNTINYIPIGNIEDILNITISDIKDFIKGYKDEFNLMILGKELYNLHNIIWKMESKKINQDKKKLKKDFYEPQDHIYRILSKRDEIKVYVINDIREKDIREKTIQKILQFIFINRFEQYCKNLNINTELKIAFLNKVINEDYKYNNINIIGFPINDNYKIEDLIKFVIYRDVNINEFNVGKIEFLEYIKSIGDINYQFLLDSMLGLMLNDDIPFVTTKIINQVCNITNNINEEEFNIVKKALYSNAYKIIIKEYNESNEEKY